jgi:hypothetical protein
MIAAKVRQKELIFIQQNDFDWGYVSSRNRLIQFRMDGGNLLEHEAT